MPRSRARVPRADRGRYDERPAEHYSGEERCSTHSVDEELASERYRVEVERYWKRTASRRVAGRGSAGSPRPAVQRRGAQGRDASRARRARQHALRAATRPRRERTGPTALSADPWASAAPPERTGDGGQTRTIRTARCFTAGRARPPRSSNGRTDPAGATVTITGRAPRATRSATGPAPRPRSATPVPRHERSGFRPDRVAMWAVLLGRDHGAGRGGQRRTPRPHRAPRALSG